MSVVLPAPVPVAFEELTLVEKVQTVNRLYVIMMGATLLALVYMAWQMVRMSQLVAHQRPLVVRIDDVGRAEPVNVNEQTYIPNDRELKYFIARFTNLFYSRDRATVAKEYPLAGYYLTREKFEQVQATDQKTKWLEKFIASTEDNQEVQVRKIVITSDGGKYVATVDFDKVYAAPGSAESKRERYTATLHFVVDQGRVTNELIPYNPLGFFIDYVKTDQAF